MVCGRVSQKDGNKINELTRNEGTEWPHGQMYIEVDNPFLQFA